MVGELPDHFLDASNFKIMCSFPFLAAQRVSDDPIAIAQFLQAGDPSEIQLGNFPSGHNPDYTVVRCQINDSALFPASNVGIAIGETEGFKNIRESRVFPKYFPFCIHPSSSSFRLNGSQNMIIAQLVDISDLSMVGLSLVGNGTVETISPYLV